MIIDSNDLNHDYVSSDVCIVGSGIAGAILALELTKAGKSVIVVEAGDVDRSTAIVKHKSSGKEFGLTTRSIMVGGTSNLWHGVLAPLDEIDFTVRDWIPHSGWPIEFSDLKKWYSRAAGILGLNDPDYRVDAANHTTRQMLKSFPCKTDILENKLFKRPIPVCRFAEVLLKNFKRIKNSHLIYNACALELLKNENNKINRLKVGRSNGSSFYIKCQTYVICAGALESPRLLLNSNFKNRNIGRFLMDHPMGSMGQIKFRKKFKPNIYSYITLSKNLMMKAGFTIEKSAQYEFQFANHCFYLKSAFIKGINPITDRLVASLLAFRDGGLSIKDIWNVLSHPRLVFFILLTKFNAKIRYADLFFISEQVPNRDSCVRLSEEKDRFGYKIAEVDWQLNEYDKVNLRRVIDFLRLQVFDNEKVTWVEESEKVDWARNSTSAAHHLGTLRMSCDCDGGVVDENLQTFEHDNVYVCDGSVFCTAGNANSSLTIAALSCRLADHLLNKDVNCGFELHK